MDLLIEEGDGFGTGLTPTGGCTLSEDDSLGKFSGFSIRPIRLCAGDEELGFVTADGFKGGGWGFLSANFE